MGFLRFSTVVYGFSTVFYGGLLDQNQGFAPRNQTFRVTPELHFGSLRSRPPRLPKGLQVGEGQCKRPAFLDRPLVEAAKPVVPGSPRSEEKDFGVSTGNFGRVNRV